MKNNIKAIAGVGIVAATGLFGTALAAGITVPDAGRIGQGANTVAGYNTTNVKYTADTNGIITEVRFNIYEGTDQTTVVGTSGTSVYAQILATSPGTWSTACTVAAFGAATCNVSAGTTVAATAATGISVVAFKS